MHGEGESVAPPIPVFEPAGPAIGLPNPMPDGPCASFVDFNRDGFVDILIGGQLWKNDGKGKFESGAKLPGSYHSFGDFDNDGDLDVYATTMKESGATIDFKQWLLRCDGEGKYTDVAKDSGLETADGSKAHGFFDFDNDGCLDLYVAGYEEVFGSPGYRALPDHLFKGDGKGKFVDVTEKAGMNTAARQGVGVAFCDFDNDGFVDVYVSNYRLQPNFLWRNQGDGTFKEIASSAGVDSGRAHSNGIACVDFDNDGDFDIFVANLSHAWGQGQPKSKLFRNEFVPSGELKFSDVTGECGLDWLPVEGYKAEADWENCLFEDFNNDGWRDLFVTESCQGGGNNRKTPAQYGPYDGGYSKFYLSHGGIAFSRLDADNNFLRVEDSWGAGAGDFDNDGFLDLIVGSNTWKYPPEVTWFDPAAQRIVVLKNKGASAPKPGPAGGDGAEGDGKEQGQQPPTACQYINVTLTATDRPVEGCVVELLLTNEKKLRAVVDTSFGGYSVNANQLHFGLGAGSVAEIKVIFPGKEELVFKGRPGPWKNTSLLVDVSKKSQRQPRVVKPWPGSGAARGGPERKTLAPRVLVINFDPIIKSEGNTRLHQACGWNDPKKLTETCIGTLSDCSDGHVQCVLVDWIDVDAFPVKKDRFRYTEDSYMKCFRSGKGWHKPDAVDYKAIISEYKLAERVEKGEIDEVWLWGFPYGGYWESTMAGKGAYFCNSQPVDGVKCSKIFVIMGFNYERGVGEMLENFGHRTESIMKRVYGRWDRKQPYDKLNTWEKFTLYDKLKGGKSGCGDMHFAPNSEKDYDWGNRREVVSSCEDWVNYPNMTGETRTVLCTQWGDGDCLAHHTWWFCHLPKADGRGPDGKLANWWEYAFNFNAYQESK
ncbi:MAG: CRTAC1 family protein [Planctomycetota bacterium]|nr:CRTAC1 family protein [Planctomycetota bacterium]